MASKKMLKAALENTLEGHDLSAIDAVIAGINAAPIARDDDSWTVMIDPQMSSDLKVKLQERRAFRMQSDGPVEKPEQRLRRLREHLAAQDLDGFVVPRSDEHLGEYISARAERLQWLTGFNGSAGLAIVTADAAVIFTDGRYTLQVRDQVDVDLYATRHIGEAPPSDWLRAFFPLGGKLGYDPWLHTKDSLKRLQTALTERQATLVAVDSNPIDQVWADQPPYPLTPMVAHPEAFAGHSSASKRADLATELTAAGLQAFVLTSPESIAWLLNVRGGDVPRTPLSQGFAILHQNGGVDLFIDQRKVIEATRQHLGTHVQIMDRAAFGDGLDRLAQAGARIGVDSANTPAWVGERITSVGGTTVDSTDPVEMPRACKNSVELTGTVAAHKRDGVAVCRFLAWLDRHAPSGDISEMDAVAQLTQFRRDGAHFRDLSFDTISGSGPNGAIVHYRVSAETNRNLQLGDLYLVDSGGQYLDGTTDITRTIAIGNPGITERDCFTRVLKGHIALATAVFPVGTTGAQLDALARAPLWSVGLDFDHGTGHGVGSYLGVHEGPQRISKMPGSPALRPGMIISNEPGYYRTGSFGIRIENLVIVRAVEVPASEREMLAFETITLAPIDRRLINVDLLSADERAWMDAYHRRVNATIAPHLDAADQVWLAVATAPL
jgi:Xaa-Pro aminopeptidase